MPIETHDSIEVDDDFYNDFVIIEKLDVQKYNAASKLLEEEKIKDSGASKCLISKTGSSKDQSEYTLEDF